jgi:hypothetical protein
MFTFIQGEKIRLAKHIQAIQEALLALESTLPTLT